MESKTVGTENRFAEAGEGLMVYHRPTLWESGGLELLWVLFVVVFPRLFACIKVLRIEQTIKELTLLYISYTFLKNRKLPFKKVHACILGR